MSLETGTYISDLVATNPTSTDLKSEGDNHLRLLKSTIKATFPSITGALTSTHTQLNFVTGVTSAIQTQLDAKAPLASPTLTGTPLAPTAAAATNTTQIATTAHVFAERTNTATLTNKTLTAPVINSPTGITKTDVGLGNVDNTSDTGKPISTATQSALDAKANLASPTLTGTPLAPTASVGTNTAQIATAALVYASVSALPSGTLPTLSGNGLKALRVNVGETAVEWGSVSNVPTVVVLTSGTSWTAPAGVTKIKIRGVGGGGSGGRGSTAVPFCAGSAGGYFEKTLTVTPSTSYTIAIGSGGAVQTTNGTAGNAGGNTTFNDGTTTYTANGGTGGNATLPAAGTSPLVTGGTASNGDINIQGGPGLGAATSGPAYLSTGGNTPLGMGGIYTQTSSQGASGYGAGGHGSPSGTNSNAGTAGVLIIQY